jgi:hypothetical protein
MKMKKIKGENSGFKILNSRSKIGNLNFEFHDSKFKDKKIYKSRFKFSNIICFSLVCLILPNFACVNKSLLKGNKNTAVIVEEKNISPYERDLQTMKTANFDYIFAFRRKDSGVFDSEDKKYLRANTPPGTNRFISTDEDRAFIAGSTYEFSAENLQALRSRFLVEDYSKPENERQKANQNTNTNQNINVNR